MALFGFGKKKEEEKAPVCCGKPADGVCCGEPTDGVCCGEPTDGVCCVKVLGAGCKACHELYEHAKAAVAELGLDAGVEYVTDMEKVMAYGVMTVPALVVNERVVSVGKVLKKDDVREILQGFLA